MARSISKPAIAAVFVFILVAAALRFFGGDIYNALLRMHGRGPGH